MQRRAGGLALVIILSAATTLPESATGATVQEVPCDGDFHVVKKFTRGRRTGVFSPTISGTDLWLFQTFTDKEGEYRAQLKKWDGSLWTTIAVPRPAQGFYYPTSLDVTEDQSVWLAGWHQTSAAEKALVLRWKAQSWEETPVPEFEHGSPLVDLDMLSPDEGWAVGEYELGENRRPLTLRWNGEAWEHVDAPGTSSATLNAVSAAASDDVWAVGRAGDPLAIHWDGAAWVEHALPPVEDRFLHPLGVHAASSDEAWTVGAWEGDRSRSAVIAWDGATWSDEPVRDFRGHDSLTSVDEAAGVGWIVGGRRSNSGTFPIALRLGAGGWNRIEAENPGRGGHLIDVEAAQDGSAWGTGRASSRRLGLFGVLQKACM